MDAAFRIRWDVEAWHVLSAPLSTNTLRAFPNAAQARIEAVGQVLMWKAVEAAPGLQRLGRRSRRPARAASDRYEEHMLLPDERVALITSQRLMLVHAPGFAKVPAVLPTLKQPL